MNPLDYLKAVVGAVGATAFPPICAWLASYVPAPPEVQSALVMLFIALLTGGVIYAAPNRKQQPDS